MNTQPRALWLLALLTAVSFSLFVGCQSASRDSGPSEKIALKAEFVDDSTSAANVAKHPEKQSATVCYDDHGDSRLMQARTTNQGKLVAMSVEDTLGFFLQEVLSAPGMWTFVNSPGTREAIFEGAEKPIPHDVLMYSCYDDLYEYPNCGKPESIGNPAKRDDNEYINIFFTYKINLCDSTFATSFYRDAAYNSPYAEEFLTHHGFSLSDTITIDMKKIIL